ncbi:succinate dehydrogenase / fumarate reductase membrane anchor subunit [Sphingomonas naasensis]|uniref:Succinate dehydrogenase hydrophobic membrane anchor subunit n=1 Tax=Sphingomonas naasensis TaxID=1344951 RepID=A0A4S1WEN8_9SPHN|nr:succinate dehydrogenase, hydrophobic membrane anchor protein [Sphingomonas naasensis]NIJ19918.1 succinate dehydrogenase / fumarate reductase membrane anchor subunit [Sphingomonas naasensis]TGX39960.1 succinate dehydrogenase, hydrophobic membrane anchor protein [Sphingomonas naasensis]
MGNGTSIGRVRGLGSAHEGSHGWWHHKISAGSNLILVLWFLISLALLPAYDSATLAAWIAQPLVAVPLILLVVSVFYHFHHGLTVVIEDYQHDHTRFVLLLLLKYFTIATATLAIFSILKVAFTAGAAL